MQAYKKKGFWVGVSLFVLFNLLPPPSGLSEAGWIVASVTVLMAAWWRLVPFRVVLCGRPFLYLYILWIACVCVCVSVYVAWCFCVCLIVFVYGCLSA